MAVLLTSEVVSNVVLHAGGVARLAMSSDVPGCLRVEVADSSRGGVHHRPRASGRPDSGLGLVEVLARRWGVTEGTDGKTVWFELDTAA